jgi:uncharacterized membrane protein YhaH (DUF805 family)
MKFQDAVSTCFRRYTDFTGRAARPEYWWFFLFVFLCSVVLTTIDSRVLGTGNVLWSFGLLNGLFTLAIIVPMIAVGVRRLHDIGKPGWWMLIGLIPLVGGLVLIYWHVQRGMRGPNEYGPAQGR